MKMGLAAGLLLGALAACSDGDDTTTTGSTSSSSAGTGGGSTSSTSAGGSTTSAGGMAGAGGVAGAGGAGGVAGAGGAGGVAGAGGAGGMAGAGGAGGMAGVGGGGGAGGSEQVINGCTTSIATDATMMATFVITAADPWVVTHQACAIVSAGSSVTWQGNFVAHPLVGGIPNTTDVNSPITLAAPVGGSTTVSFPNAGTFPYFCTVHGAAMQGVVYVVP